MVDFDPYESAKRMNDEAALDSWRRYEEALLSAPVIAINPHPYLQYEYPDQTNEYGALPGIWEESIRQVLQMYEGSFAQAFAAFSNEVKLEKRSYTPPFAYQRGGPFSYPTDLLQLVMDEKWLASLGAPVAAGLMVNAITEASRKLRQWWNDHRVPESEQILPSHSPAIIRAVVESEAHRCFPNLMPGTATIESTLPLDADYPVNGSLFRVTLPYANGTIIFLVDDRLRRPSIFRTSPAGTRKLDASCWLEDETSGGVSSC